MTSFGTQVCPNTVHSITFVCASNSIELTWSLDDEQQYNFSLRESQVYKSAPGSHATLLVADVGYLVSDFTLSVTSSEPVARRTVTCSDGVQNTHFNYTIIGMF